MHARHCTTRQVYFAELHLRRVLCQNSPEPGLQPEKRCRLCSSLGTPSVYHKVQEAGEGGAEEDLDPAELAAKMDGVKAWLDASATALPQEQAAPAGKTPLDCRSGRRSGG